MPALLCGSCASVLERKCSNHVEPTYEQDDREGVERAYGLVDHEPLVQHLGHVTTPARRALAWPNSLQHRVEPFELLDKSREGRRQMLVFFLVDPNVRVTSTADVAPQQASWLQMELRMMPLFRKLPAECLQRITDLLVSPQGHYIDEEAARRRRAALMHERKYFVDESNEEYFARPFSLCEH